MKRCIVSECEGFGKFWTPVLRDLRMIIDETTDGHLDQKRCYRLQKDRKD